MLPHIPRPVRWAVVVVVVGAVAAAVFQSWRSESGIPAEGWTQTEFGPLGPGDRELLVKVRLAGLWEMPTGQEIQQRASSQKVREAGAKIAKEHAELDAIVRDAAVKLGVMLPNQPSAEQQGWMAEITTSTGPEYDQLAINRLRAAHGKVLPVIAQVRSGTRNDLVRKFATTAATFVTRHHEYLESTGLVDFSALPEPAAPAGGGAAPAGTGAGAGAGANPAVGRTATDEALSGPQTGVAAVIFLGAVLGIVLLLGFMRRGNRRRPGPPSKPARRRAPVVIPRQRRHHTATMPVIPAVPAELDSDVDSALLGVAAEPAAVRRRRHAARRW